MPKVGKMEFPYTPKGKAMAKKAAKKAGKSGQRKRHDGFNKSIIRDGMIVILRKDGSEKTRFDPKTKKIVKGSK